MLNVFRLTLIIGYRGCKPHKLPSWVLPVVSRFWCRTPVFNFLVPCRKYSKTYDSNVPRPDYRTNNVLSS